MVKKRKSFTKEEPKPPELPLPPPPPQETDPESDPEEEDQEEFGEEEEAEAQDSSSSEEEEDDEDSKRETVKKLLEPFGKDQLINIIKEAAITNPSIAAEIIKSAESDPVHRKIFVHGLSWDITNDSLTSAFKQYGTVEECNVVTDKITGRSKGYGFVLFKTRAGARKSLKQPQKQIGSRMAACQLAAAGTVLTQPSSEPNGRKLFIANVGAQVSIDKLREFFTRYGEIEDGPSGFDKATGKFKGFAIIVFKTTEGIKKALEEPVKMFEGCKLQCSIWVQGRNAKNNTTGQVVVGSGASATGNVASYAGAAFAPNNVALQPLPVGLNPGLIGQNFNPGGILMGQIPAIGVMNPVFGIGAGTNMNQVGVSPSFASGISQPLNLVGSSAPMGLNGGFGMQPVINSMSPSVIGSYGSNAALQGLVAYPGSQLGQSSASGIAAVRPHTGAGSTGTLPPYFAR
ncbi:RNA-binding protein [Quillaja saponaria]|uniref:RNA-binding protein n=1 Tax=Quillaja saponaria TaxID=32244 RepID=A0AAD7LM57_QUISA|nr:RNA-binding protein [Quillaja saponaria]